jgi:electron transport complex protein RnfB
MIEAIEALLPQLQCGKCGYDDCKAYAKALADNKALPNRCSPGKEEVGKALAAFLKQPFTTLAEDVPPHQVAVAIIDENRCIGCTLCLRACPTDAIIGAKQRLHVTVETWCSGCERCLAPCPTDAIVMQPRALPMPDKMALKTRYAQHQARRHQEAQQKERWHLEKLSEALLHAHANPRVLERKAIIEKALQKAKARLAKTNPLAE